MPAFPKVSVIVPVFNAGEKLIPSIESLLNQTLKGIEIIIVNDASVDNSGSIIDQLAREHTNVVPVHLSENKGVHEARLAGLKKSTASWIGFLDADDFARPNMFSKMYASAVDHRVDIVVCGSDRVDEQRKFVAKKLQFNRSEKIDIDVFERFCNFEFGTGMLWNKLFKRSVIEPWFTLHFPWRQNINEDLLLSTGCFYNADSVYLCKEVLHDYVITKFSVTFNSVNARSYVDTYRAAAIAVSIFSKLGDEALVKVINMYRAQLSWSSYQVSDVGDIISYYADLEAAVELMNRSHPASLALLTARQRPAIVGTRLALKSLSYRVFSSLGLASIFDKLK